MENNDATTGATLLKEGVAKGSGELLTVKIEGMTCDHCAHTVAEALFGVTGVQGVKVWLDEGKAMINTDGTPTTAQLAAAVEAVGYKLVV